MNSGKFGSLRETQNNESDAETGSKLSGEVGGEERAALRVGRWAACVGPPSARSVDPALSFLSVALAAYDDGPRPHVRTTYVCMSRQTHRPLRCMARGL